MMQANNNNDVNVNDNDNDNDTLADAHHSAIEHIENQIQSHENKNIITQPSLPSLYFVKADENSDSTFQCPTLCSELETNIYSYLTWGDYARMAPTHSRVANIMHDAAHQSSEHKWSLAQSLLHGENGLEENPALARNYLMELANVTVDLEKSPFNPNYEEMPEHVVVENDDEHEVADTDSSSSHATAAMRQLALCYLEGKGVETHTTTGLAWLQQAYRHGDLDAAYETATIYEHGTHGVTVDIYIAARWFLGAAEKGHVESMAEYAMCLELGCGVDVNDNEALDWYTKAAEKGHVTSNFSVAEMFESARGGVPQSDTEAVLWYFKAAKMGDEDSVKALRRLNDIARIVVPGWANTLGV